MLEKFVIEWQNWLPPVVPVHTSYEGPYKTFSLGPYFKRSQCLTMESRGIHLWVANCLEKIDGDYRSLFVDSIFFKATVRSPGELIVHLRYSNMCSVCCLFLPGPLSHESHAWSLPSLQLSWSEVHSSETHTHTQTESQVICAKIFSGHFLPSTLYKLVMAEG